MAPLGIELITYQFVFHEENDRKNKEIILKQVFKYTPTVSAILQPQGFIFQVDFLSKKNPKYYWTFHITWGSIQERGCNIADTVGDSLRKSI